MQKKAKPSVRDPMRTDTPPPESNAGNGNETTQGDGNYAGKGNYGSKGYGGKGYGGKSHGGKGYGGKSYGGKGYGGKGTWGGMYHGGKSNSGRAGPAGGCYKCGGQHYFYECPRKRPTPEAATQPAPKKPRGSHEGGLAPFVEIHVHQASTN